MELKELRKERKLTQKEAAGIVGIPYRTYCRYEETQNYKKTYKYKKIYEDLFNATRIDESHGLLSLEDIKSKLMPVLIKNNISYCYLFGSYARAEAKETSDIDLLVDTKTTGIDFFMLIEEIRKALNKRIDLIRLADLQERNPIVLEILKEGIRII